MVAPPGCCEICQIAEVLADPALQNRSVRITGRLEMYDAQQKVATLSFQKVSMTVETQRLSREHLRLQLGAMYQFLGETYTKVPDVYVKGLYPCFVCMWQQLKGAWKLTSGDNVVRTIIRTDGANTGSAIGGTSRAERRQLGHRSLPCSTGHATTVFGCVRLIRDAICDT